MARSRTIATSLLLLCAGCTPTERTAAVGAEPEGESAAIEASPYLNDIVQVDAAKDLTCALTSGGAVYCWGQLTEIAVNGDRAAPLFGMAATRPVRVPGPAATQIVVSERRVAMLDANASLFVAGEFDSAWPDTAVFRATGTKNVKLMFKPPNRSAPMCWLTADGVMECDTGDRRVIPAGLFVDARAPGCIADANSVQCSRGYRTIGALQDRCVTDDNPALEGMRAYRFASSGRPTALYEAEEAGCILTEAGAVQCVARRQKQEVCSFTAEGSSCETSSTRSSVNDNGPFIDLATGPMGRPLSYGLAANGSVTDVATQAPVPGTGFVTALGSSPEHTCGLRADRKVVCWGINRVGQLGTGQPDNTNRPQLVLAPEVPQDPGGNRIAKPAVFGLWTSAEVPDTPPAALCPLVVPDPG